MTPAHAFFIPSVFFLGFLFGGIVASRRAPIAVPQGDAKLSGPTGRTLMIAFIVFAGIFSATHLFPQFGGSKAISVAVHGMPILDQRPAFSSIDVFQRLEAFGEAGRAMYQRFTYSADIVFPLSLLVFLALLARFAAQRIMLSAAMRNMLVVLPLIWFGADMMENAIVYTLISQFPAKNDYLGEIVGLVTVSKFILLLLSIATPAILLVVMRKDTGQADAGAGQLRD